MSAGEDSPRRTITTSRQLMTNTLLNLLNQVITVLVNFAMVGFFLDTLGEERYGVWLLIGSIFSYRNIMSMGLNSAVNRNIPVYIARGDFESVRRVINTAFAYYLLPATILAIATLVVYTSLESWFSISPELVDTASIVVLVVGLSFSFTVPLQVYAAVLSSYQRYDIINFISIASILLRTLVVILMLREGHGLLVLSALYAGTEVAIRLVAMVASHRLLGGFSLSLRSTDRSLLARMMTYGVSTILYMSGAVLVFKTADLIIAATIGATAVPRFFIATTPVLLLTTVVQVFSQAMKPAISELDTLDDTQRIEEMALLSQKYTLFAILPGVAFIFIMGREFLTVWIGERYPAPESLTELTTALYWLTIGAALRLTQHTNFIVLVGKGQHRAYGIATALIIISSIVLEILAATWLDLGLVGIALGCAIPMALVSTAFLPAYFHAKTGIPFTSAVRRSWAPAVASTLPAILLIAAWQALRPPGTWFELIGVVALVGATTAASGWLLGLEPTERARIKRLIVR